MEDVYSAIKTAITRSESAWMEDGADEVQISALESAFGIALPPSYRQFLARVGAFSIGDELIAGIINGDALLMEGGSVYAETHWVRKDYALPDTLLVINPNDEAPHCIDFSTANRAGEMDIVCYQLNTGSAALVAKGFDQWLHKWVLPLL